jgi:hypothetical protein
MPIQISPRARKLDDAVQQALADPIADVQSSEPPARFLRTLLDGQPSMLLEGIQSWMWCRWPSKMT